jgi:hypothetical protein
LPNVGEKLGRGIVTSTVAVPFPGTFTLAELNVTVPAFAVFAPGANVLPVVERAG